VTSGRLAKWIDVLATDNDFSLREKLKRFGRGLRPPRGLRGLRELDMPHDMSRNVEPNES
jgi:hypothetical protein